MSMRLKAGTAIMLIVFVITAASFFFGYYFTQKSLAETMEQDMSLAVEIAGDLVAEKIRFIKSNAAAIAGWLSEAGSDADLPGLMASQIGLFPDFTALSVFDRDGNVVANYGAAISPDETAGGKRYIDMAFAGESIVTGTLHDKDTGELLIYVFTPMGPDRVLGAAIPGFAFYDLIAGYRLWQTGNIFIIDAEGTTIANIRPNFVMDRTNFIELAKSDPALKETGEFFLRMLSSGDERGSDSYLFDGQERLCVYKRLADAGTDWHIGVVAPLNESPKAGVTRGLLTSSLLFLAAGALAAVLLSGIIARPFNTINRQAKEIKD
ncbi:MAG: hypothetical protein FWD39_05960, partial [Clostridiales bacterium]|nr:hypothetical protein [Clostridiales bacterium]